MSDQAQEQKQWMRVFNTLCSNWYNLLDHRTIARAGEEVRVASREAALREAYAQLQERDLKLVPIGAGGEVLTDENFDRHAKAEGRRAIQNASALTESLAVVLAHAVFEQAITDLCNVAIDAMPNSYFEAKYPDRKVILRDAVVSPHDALRRSLKWDVKRTDTLLANLKLLVAFASSQDAPTCSELSKLYKVDESEIERIDLFRQGIMHRVEVQPGYVSDPDILILEHAVRYYFHIIANCLYPEGIGLLTLSFTFAGKPILGPKDWESGNISEAHFFKRGQS